jgi:glycosyltransferase involved in cell wall biosynthesis
MWVKGVRNLLQAMPLILEEYPQTKLVILGKGEEQKDVLETAARLGIPIELFAASNLFRKKREFCTTPLQTLVFSHRYMNPSES